MDINRVLHYQELSFISKIILIKLISQHHNNLLVGYFDINKTRIFIGQKYYWLNFKKDVEAYAKGCNICLSFKLIKYKPYDNLQILLILIYK